MIKRDKKLLALIVTTSIILQNAQPVLALGLENEGKDIEVVTVLDEGDESIDESVEEESNEETLQEESIIDDEKENSTEIDNIVESTITDEIKVIENEEKTEDVSVDKKLASDLIISEYIEGSSNNKAIEIYNGTGETIDLSEYQLELYINGKTTVNKTEKLTGQLEHDKTLVIVHSSSNEDIKSKGDIESAVTSYNGNDALVLKKGDAIVDSIGKVGEDPGDAWENNGVSTKDMTLVRDSSITSGDTNPFDDFDPSVEWEANEKDSTVNLGTHAMDVVMGADTVSPVIEFTVDSSTEHNIINDYSIACKVTDDRKVRSVTAFYKTSNDTEYKKLQLTLDSDSLYIGKIPKENLGGEELDIYIEASDGTNISITEKQIVKLSNLDVTAPVISKVYPSNEYNTGSNLRPEIGADYNDETGVDISSIELELDGVSITDKATITENSIRYTPENDLEEGQHTLKLTLNDTVSKENSISKEWTFYVGEEDVELYFGSLHSHTNYSDGTGTVQDAYEYAKNNAAVDFLAITDHSNSFDNADSANILDGSASVEWVEGQQLANEYNIDDEFVAMFGYEMSWSASTGGYGHMNTFNTPGFENRTNSKMDLETYYKALKTVPESISQYNHPGKLFGDFSGYAHYDEEIDELITLIEVGNGDGAVGSSGYFKSYDEYIKALDKGWHLAPTNGQDNHKGKWGDANTTRTVILASELTRESLYDAMRSRRVYSTEDENLEINYKINGNVMGTILDDTDELNFEISINDPDTSESRAKVEIIANGGKVVKTMNMSSNSEDFRFTLPSDYSYYFVKVTQADGQIAVTSPIWVGDVVSVGINSIEVDKDTAVVGDEINVTTNIYNNESVSATDVKVEYFLEEELEDNKIGEEMLGTVAGTTEVISNLRYTASKVGTFDIIAKVTMSVDGIEMVMSEKVSVTVKDESLLSKVIIDASKQNYYVSGDYANNINELVSLISKNDGKATLNTEELTSDTLDGVSLLVITDPQSYSTSSGLEAKTYSEAEIEVIKNFVANGGNLVITSRADYKDSTVHEYQNSVQGNQILEAIGSSLRFNDDQVIDEVNYSNQTYRLYFDRYDTESSLLAGINREKTFSFYSGCSVIIDESVNPDTNAKALVKGHATTKTTDSDNQGDAIAVEDGEVIALASETLQGGGTVVVGGTTFFSDYELKESSASTYSNADIMANIINELAPKKSLPVTTIAEVRKDEDNNNVPDNLGKTFVVEGTVTVGTNAASPVNSFFDCLYVQDETGGITVFGVSETAVKVGQKVRIQGIVDEYLGDTELSLTNEFTDITILDESINEIEPKLLSTHDSMLEENEGLLTKVIGEVVKIDGNNIYVNDGTGIARALVEGYIGSSSTGELDSWQNKITVGDTVSIVGMASEDGEPMKKRLRVRDTDEIVKVLVEEDDSNKGEEDTNKPDNDGSVDNDNNESDNDSDNSMDNDNNTSDGDNLDKDEPNDSNDSVNNDSSDKDETDKPTDSEDNNQTPGNDSNNSNSNSSTSSSGNSSSNNQNTSNPSTGDIAVGGFIATAIASLAGLGILNRKRNKK